MKTRYVGLLLLLCSALLIASDRPEWATRAYAGSPDQVFRAAKMAVEEQHHEIKVVDEAKHTLKFHVGTTAWSWGYNMILQVTANEKGESIVTIDIDRSGGKAVSWGSGSKEVRKIFDGTARQLQSK